MQRCPISPFVLLVLTSASCAGPFDYDAYVEGPAAAGPGVRPRPSHRTFEVEVDGESRMLGVWRFDGADAGTTFVFFDGTPSGGVRTSEELLVRLSAHGDVLMPERFASSARTFDELAAIHAQWLRDLDADRQLEGRLVFVGFSFGSQVLLRTARLLEHGEGPLVDRAFLISPSLGPRLDGEVPDVDRTLVRYSWLPSSFLRTQLSVDGIHTELEHANPNDEVPVVLSEIAYAALRLRHAITQTAGLTRQELRLPPPERDGPLASAVARDATLAVFGGADPGFTDETQGAHAERLGIETVVIPAAGHHAHTFYADTVYEIVRRGLVEPRPRGRGQ